MSKNINLTPLSVRYGNRGVKLNFSTGYSGPEVVVAQVFIAHDPSRKSFYASLNTVTIEDASGHKTEAFFPFDGITLTRKPVGRYSEKALNTFVHEVQAQIPKWIDENPKVAAIFAGTAQVAT